MKKLLATAALLVAGIFVFSGCTKQVATKLNANWQKTSAYDQNYYELLEYSVAFSDADSTYSLKIVPDLENSSYVVETQALASENIDGTTYYDIYYLRSELTMAAQYVDKDTNKVVAQFGGTYDTSEADSDDVDTIVTEIWFHSLKATQEREYNLEPIRSVKTVRSHVPNNVNDTTLSLYNYSVTTVYNDSCTSATISYKDLWGELSDEDKKVSDSVTKETHPQDGKSVTLKDLQKRFTAFDNAQLYFAARGINFKSGSSNTLNIVGEAGSQEITLSCSELSTRKAGSLTLDGKELGSDLDIPVSVVSFAITSNGKNSGQPKKVYFAQKSDGAENTYYNLPVRIEEAGFFAMGTMQYTLRSASHTKA